MLNPNLHATRRRQYSTEEYLLGIRAGNRVLLSQAITLVESSRSEHRAQAQAVIEACLPYANASIRIGITGTPGVGKSTFIETFGLGLLQEGRKVAVLAIDPSSQVSRGSILGDKTRMMHLSVHEHAFVRPSPAGASLGGVAQKTRETIVLCEAAGFDTILVETVGVGQSETAVHAMTDFFLLLLLPGAGDELQGIKRGIVEMADLIAVNKADEGRELLAKQARAAYNNALHLFPPKSNAWFPKAVTCSAIAKNGIDGIWKLILDYLHLTQSNGFFEKNRREQAKYWLKSSIEAELLRRFYEDETIKNTLLDLEQQVLKGEKSSFRAAEEILNIYATENFGEVF